MQLVKSIQIELNEFIPASMGAIMEMTVLLSMGLIQDSLAQALIQIILIHCIVLTIRANVKTSKFDYMYLLILI